MKDPRHRPMDVGPNADGTMLRIRWHDGHESQYTPWELRLACPCAGCVDEMTGKRMLRPETMDPGVHPVEITYVGRYALRFRWSDGHDTGIYPFEFLRRLCGCAACTES